MHGEPRKAISWHLLLSMHSAYDSIRSSLVWPSVGWMDWWMDGGTKASVRRAGGEGTGARVNGSTDSSQSVGNFCNGDV